MLKEKSEQAVTFCYGVRLVDHYLFFDLITRGETELCGFGKKVCCEAGSVAGEVGVLKSDSIFNESPRDMSFFLSGPPFIIDSFRNSLCNLGGMVEDIHIDDWE